MKKLSLTAAVLSGVLSTGAWAGPYDKPGFVTELDDGRLWVFREGSKELEEFKKTGEPVKQYTDIGNGPNGMTVKAADEQTLKDYLATLQ